MCLFICMYTYIHIYIYICILIYRYISIHVPMHNHKAYEGSINFRTTPLSKERGVIRAMFPHFLCLSLVTLFLRFTLCLSLLSQIHTHVTTRHQHGVQTAHMRLVRTIKCARNPRLACGVGSRSRVDMCHIWPTMCAAATGIFGHTCWPSLRASVPAFEAPLSHLEFLSSTSICHAQVCPHIGCESAI